MTITNRAMTLNEYIKENQYLFVGIATIAAVLAIPTNLIDKLGVHSIHLFLYLMFFALLCEVVRFNYKVKRDELASLFHFILILLFITIAYRLATFVYNFMPFLLSFIFGVLSTVLISISVLYARHGNIGVAFKLFKENVSFYTNIICVASLIFYIMSIYHITPIDIIIFIFRLIVLNTTKWVLPIQ